MVHVTGTLINAGTVLAGTTAGTVLGDRLPERVREVVMDGLGLVVLLVGIDQGLAAFRPPFSTLVTGAAAGGVPVLIVLGSILLGGIAGEIIGIERGLVAAGDALKRRFGSGQARFTEGFVVASLVFCVGPLTILGAISEGLSGDYSLLAVKAMLDGFTALAFSSVSSLSTTIGPPPKRSGPTFTFWMTLGPKGKSGCVPSMPLSMTAAPTPRPVTPSSVQTADDLGGLGGSEPAAQHRGTG